MKGARRRKKTQERLRFYAARIEGREEFLKSLSPASRLAYALWQKIANQRNFNGAIEFGAYEFIFRVKGIPEYIQDWLYERMSLMDNIMLRVQDEEAEAKGENK